MNRIRSKIPAASLCAVILAFVLYFCWTANTYVERTLKASLAETLQSDLASIVKTFEIWAEQQKSTAFLWAHEKETREAVLAQASLFSKKGWTREDLLRSPHLQALKNHLGPVVKQARYEGFVITDPNGINIAASSDEEVGQKNGIEKNHYPKDYLARETILALPFMATVPLPEKKGTAIKKPLMFVSSPVKNNNGEIVAHLSLRINPNTSFVHIFETMRHGKSGEAYAFNAKGMMVSRSRFEGLLLAQGLIKENSTLEMKVLDPGGNIEKDFKPGVYRESLPYTLMARSALKGESSFNVNGYRDYRGVEVVGAWAWFPEYGLGITMEVDTDEAMLLHQTLKNIIRFLLFLVICLYLTVFSIYGLSRRVKERGKRINAILENSADGIIATDNAGTIQSFNPMAVRMFGYLESEITGKNIKVLIAESSQGEYEKYFKGHLDAVFTKNTCKRREVFGKRRDESAFPMEISVQETLLNKEPLFVFSLVDVTEQKKSKEKIKKSEQEIRTIINTVGEGIVAINSHLKMDIANQEFCRIFGYTEMELQGADIRKLVPALCLKADSIELAEYPESKPSGVTGQHAETKGLHKNGHFFPIEINMERNSENETDKHLFIGAVRDISKRKEAEEELKKSKEAAEEATRLKDKFISLVAHDLRAPLTSIIGFLNLIFYDKTHPLHSQQKEMVKRSLGSGNRLIKMIDELLKVSRFQAGQITLNPKFINAHQVANAVFMHLTHLAQVKGITLNNQIPVNSRFYADPHLLNEVLLNVVSNAIKFCDTGDAIAVFIPRNKEATIAVKDTGTGIDSDILPNLFQPEIQTTRTGTRKEKGIGLGLPFCRDIMKAHGGDITVESVREEGSIFYIRIPAVKPKVLIVDDDASSRDLLKAYMEDLDLEIMESDNGKTAMDVMEETIPHLVLADLEMPGMNGFSLLERIKNNAESKSVPVIVVTSDTEIKTREKALCIGASDYITKPLSLEDLVPRVKKCLQVGEEPALKQ